MNGFDLSSIGAGLAKIADLLEILRRKSKDRQLAEVIGEFQSAFFETKTKAFELYVENTELKTAVANIKAAHATEIRLMTTAHAAEVTQLQEKHLAEIAATRIQKTILHGF